MRSFIVGTGGTEVLEEEHSIFEVFETTEQKEHRSDKSRRIRL